MDTAHVRVGHAALNPSHAASEDARATRTHYQNKTGRLQPRQVKADGSLRSSLFPEAGRMASCPRTRPAALSDLRGRRAPTHTLPEEMGGSRSWVWRETPGRTRKSQGLQERGASSCHLSSRSPGAWGPRDCQRAPLSQAPGPHLTMHSRTECHSGDTPWSHCPGSTPGSTSNLPAPGLPPPRFPRLYIEDDSDCHKELDEPKSAKPLEQCLVYSEHHISAHQAKLPRF